MNPDLYIVWAILAMFLATFLTRILPFIFLSNRRKSPVLEYIGAYLPPAAMFLLVVYCLKDLSFTHPPYAIAESLSVVLVALIHLWKRHALLSIGLGTAFYAWLVQRDVIERVFALL